MRGVYFYTPPAILPIEVNYQSNAEDVMELLSCEETAKILGVRPQTLATWRLYGRPLPYCKIGRLVKYRRSDVLAFIEQSMKGGGA